MPIPFACRVASILPVLLLTLTATACGPLAGHPPAPPPAAALTKLSPADELYELSPARVHIRRLAPQAVRLLAPHWSSVRESDRKALQTTLLGTLAEERIAPFLRAHLKKAVEADPAMATAALEWLRSPLGYEVKFAEATAWAGDKAPEDTFYANVAEVRDNRTPEIRMDRIKRLADATGALDRNLDLTASVGTVVARLVNVARPGARALSAKALAQALDRERRAPAVAAAYTPVVEAAMLVRCRDLDLDELDHYIEFASTDAGRWYHAAFANALVAAVQEASMDVEGVFDVNAHAPDAKTPEAAGFDLDSLLVALPSGREVRLLALAQAGPQAQPAVVLRYETSLPLHDASAIGVEAREVWDKVRDQVESEGARAAVLQPTGSVDGWVFPFASSRKYAWRRDEAGAWTAVQDGPGSFGSVQREMLWSIPP